jgi:hypothetical protein
MKATKLLNAITLITAATSCAQEMVRSIQNPTQVFPGFKGNDLVTECQYEQIIWRIEQNLWMLPTHDKMIHTFSLIQISIPPAQPKTAMATPDMNIVAYLQTYIDRPPQTSVIFLMLREGEFIRSDRQLPLQLTSVWR